MSSTTPKALIPIKVGVGSFHRDHFNKEANMVNHRLHMNLLEEVRQMAQLLLAAYQQRTEMYFNGKAKFRPFQIGDLVLKKVMSHAKIASH